MEYRPVVTSPAVHCYLDEIEGALLNELIWREDKYQGSSLICRRKKHRKHQGWSRGGGGAWQVTGLPVKGPDEKVIIAFWCYVQFIIYSCIYLGFGYTSSRVQGPLLTLCSGLFTGDAQGTICGVRDSTEVGSRQRSNLWTIALALALCVLGLQK